MRALMLENLQFEIEAKTLVSAYIRLLSRIITFGSNGVTPSFQGQIADLIPATRKAQYVNIWLHYFKQA